MCQGPQCEDRFSRKLVHEGVKEDELVNLICVDISLPKTRIEFRGIACKLPKTICINYEECVVYAWVHMKMM